MASNSQQCCLCFHILALSCDWVVFHALSLVSLNAFLNKHWLLGTASPPPPFKKYLIKSFLLGCLLLSNLRYCILMWLLCQVCALWLSPTLRKTSGLVVWLNAWEEWDLHSIVLEGLCRSHMGDWRGAANLDSVKDDQSGKGAARAEAPRWDEASTFGCTEQAMV